MRLAVPAVLSAALVLVGAAAYGYSIYAKWPSVPVTFYINPANSDVTSAAATAALQFAMNVWNQSGSSFRYQYGGPASDTATRYDNRNVVLFRNTTNGGAIATTYSWWDSNNHLLDSDIIVWDGGFKFFTGSSGCGTYANAAYLEDVATHEFGHALGLNHSSTSGATMQSSYSYCSQTQRTLASDDINAAKALYPPTAATNSAPVVSITSPANGATFNAGATLSFAGSAMDAQDGNISSKLQWTDNGTAVGSGSLLSKILSVVGTHLIVAKASDSGGMQGSSQVSITITVLSSASTQGTLTAKKNGGVVSDGTARAYLYWSGLSGSQVDVYRNTVKVITTSNDGDYKDYLPRSSTRQYAYKVCSAGTQTCTNSASVTF